MLDKKTRSPKDSTANLGIGDISIYGRDEWAQQQGPFRLAMRAGRVELRGQQSKQSNATTRRPAVMNLALRGIETGFGPEHAATFRRVLHPHLRADTATRVSAKPQPRSRSAGLLRSERQLLANPPFNNSDTALRNSAFLQTGGTLQAMTERHDNFRKDDDVRWQPSGARLTAKGSPQGERGGVHQFGVPPKGNANFARVQHFTHHLAPQGMAGFVLSNGNMSSNQSGGCPARSTMRTPIAKPQNRPRQRDIHRALIKADIVDAAMRDRASSQSEAKNNIVAIPCQLSYSTQTLVCLWFLAKSKSALADTIYKWVISKNDYSRARKSKRAKLL